MNVFKILNNLSYFITLYSANKVPFYLFKKCRSLADSLQLPDCSMGMSGDWKEAIDAGSTWLRLGSLIFGDRS